MSDLVERLRKANSRVLLGGMNEQPVFLSAMQEIERLRELLKAAEEDIERKKQHIAYFRAEVAALKGNAEPIGYFCDVNMLTPEQGKRIEQVVEEAKHDPDVFPLYTSPRIPDGWVMVPEKRSPIGGSEHGWEGEYNRGWNDCIDAMIAAAPKP